MLMYDEPMSGSILRRALIGRLRLPSRSHGGPLDGPIFVTTTEHCTELCIANMP